MKNLTFIILLFLTANLTAQTKKKPVKTATVNKLLAAFVPNATAVIRGNIKNFTDKYLEMAVTGDLTNYTITIPVDKDGDFNKTINIEQQQQKTIIRGYTYSGTGQSVEITFC